MDPILQRAQELLAENDRAKAKTQFMAFLANKREKNSPVDKDEAYAAGYIYGALGNGQEDGFSELDKAFADRALRNIIRVSEGYEESDSKLPSLQNQPDLSQELEAIDPQIEAALKKEMGEDNYNKLDPASQCLLKSNYVRNNAESLNINPPVKADSPVNADDYSEQYIVDFVNKVVDNANNYIGMTKVGPTTAVILQGELHGRLSSVNQGDRKDFLAGPDDVDNLGNTISKRYSTYNQDLAADKKVNEDIYTNRMKDNDEAFREKKSATPRPEPGSKKSQTDDDKNAYRTPEPFSTIPSPYDD